jgi:drug/metabolite transporter (DMT)-like permease
MIACGNIALRTLRSINEFATGAYISLVGMTVFGLTVVFSDKGFMFPQLFTWSDYLVMASVSIIGALTMVTKAKSMQYEMASRTSITCYFSIIIMLFFDVVLYNTAFNESDFNGILIITFSNMIAGYFIFNKNNKKN